MIQRSYQKIDRRKTRSIKVGNLSIGGNAPILVQTMTNTLTSDVDATVDQIRRVIKVGADIVRVSVPDKESSNALKTICKKVNIPIIASGGVGNLDHLVEGIKLGKASAVLAASIFHYGKHSLKEAKDYLDSKGIPVRI